MYFQQGFKRKGSREFHLHGELGTVAVYLHPFL